MTVGGRQRQPDGPCSVEAETARLVRRRTGISANGCVLVLERSADGVGPDGGQVEDQAGHPRSRSGRPAAGVPAAGPRARSRRECVRRRQSRSAMPWARTRVAGGSRRFTGPGRGLGRRGSAGLDSCRAPGFRDQQGGIGNRGTRGRRCREGTGRHGAGGSRRRQLSWCCVGGGCFCGARRCRCAIDGGRRPRRRSRRDVAAWNDAAWNDAVWWPGRRVAGERSCWLRNRGRGVAGERSCWIRSRGRGVADRRIDAGNRYRRVHHRRNNTGNRNRRVQHGPGCRRGDCRRRERRVRERRGGECRVRCRLPRGGGRWRVGNRRVRGGVRGPVRVGRNDVGGSYNRPRNSARRPGARRDRGEVHGNHAVEGGNREVVGVRTARRRPRSRRRRRPSRRTRRRRPPARPCRSVSATRRRRRRPKARGARGAGGAGCGPRGRTLLQDPCAHPRSRKTGQLPTG